MSMPSMTRKGSLSSTARSMKAPGIAFVGVADEVLLRARLLAATFHFCQWGSLRRRGRASPTVITSSQTSAGVMRRQARAAAAESAARKRRIERARIDDAAVLEHHLLLAAEEGRIAYERHIGEGWVAVLSL